MIYQNSQAENTQNRFSEAISELQIGKLLRKSNITKNCGIPAYEVFQFLLLLVFHGKNLFRFLNSKHKDQAVSKNTYYRFLNETSYNWKKFLLLLAAKVTSAFGRLTRPERVNVLILDDSIVKRNRSKKVELLARVYDHVEHKFQKGFTLLTLGWSDGYSFVPVGFNLLSSASRSNRYEGMSGHVDHRSNGYKNRKESLLPKPEAAILLIKRALDAGIRADYVLMDTWFTTEPMMTSILAEGLDAIGMVKQLKQRYSYKGRRYTLPELQRFVRFDGARNIFGSLCVTTKNGIPVKIVFVRNRNKKSECLYLLSTDCSLSDSEIVRIYGNRWSIECFFKASKSFLKLGTEFQGRSYDAMVSHTTIVFTRYIILEWMRRNENDQKTYGELFFTLCDDIQDMDLTSALQGLMSLFTDMAAMVSADITEMLKSKVGDWMKSQPLFIQALFSDLCWES
ncbi:IS4 family transposase [Bacteroides congonensis]